MDRAQWRTFLELWSTEWVAGHDPERDRPLDPEVVRSRWLGFAPASGAAVTAAETRLGHRLPPSLREFLLVTDGWRNAGAFIDRLAGTAELDWLRDTPDRSWITIWQDLAGEADDPDADVADFEDEDDEDDEDDFEAATARMLARSLRLSLAGDSAVMLLDPQDVGPDGEWAAYWLASWSGDGPVRHDSFAELMRRQWRSFHALRRPPGPTRDHWDAELERGRRLAVAGELDAALDLFEGARAFGRPLAGLFLAQTRALLGDWRREVVELFWGNRDWDTVLAGPLFVREFLPLLVRQDREARDHALRPLTRLREIAPPPVRAAIAAYEARSAEPGFRLRYGPPEFDAAVQEVIDRLTAYRAAAPVPPVPTPQGTTVLCFSVVTVDGRLPRPAAGPGGDLPDERAEQAWSELLAALPLWHPLDAHHLAPLSLLAAPELDDLLTPERARSLLTTPRG